MTTDNNDNHKESNANPDPAAVPSPAHVHGRRRHSTGVVIGAGLAGLIVGAAGTIAAIAFAWIVSVGPPGPPPLPETPPMQAAPLGHLPPPPMPGPMPGGFGLAPPRGDAFPAPPSTTQPSPAPHT